MIQRVEDVFPIYDKRTRERQSTKNKPKSRSDEFASLYSELINMGSNKEK